MSSGNKSYGTFEVRVAHDQRFHDCGKIPNSSFISHEDAPVLCPVDDGSMSHEEIDESFETGCAISSASSFGRSSNSFFLLALLSLWAFMTRKK